MESKDTRPYSRFSPDVTEAMLVYRTIAMEVLGIDLITMQNLSDILLLFFTPTWPSHHETEQLQIQHGANPKDTQANLARAT